MTGRAASALQSDPSVLGAGMAGLCAAARARELGASPVVFDKGTRPGGSMLLSSGVVWRFGEWEDFRAECPTGEERLQRIVWERLDDGIAWLESLGAPVIAHDTDRKSTRLNSTHSQISYAVFCLKKKNTGATSRTAADTDALSGGA